MPKRYSSNHVYSRRKRGCLLNTLIQFIVLLVIIVLVAYYIMPYIAPTLMQYLPDMKQIAHFWQNFHITLSSK